MLERERESCVGN